jgi:hypothetical protein
VTDPLVTPAHSQQVTNRYLLSFPDHAPRASDPHYRAFETYRRLHIATSVCFVGARIGFDQCADALGAAIPVQPANLGHGLELHHHTLEFSLLNSVDLAALQVDYPFLTDAAAVQVWAETEDNLQALCAKHHRGIGGIHHAAYADFEASLYIRGLIS